MPDGVSTFQVYVTLPRAAVDGASMGVDFEATDAVAGTTSAARQRLPGTRAMIGARLAPRQRSGPARGIAGSPGPSSPSWLSCWRRTATMIGLAFLTWPGLETADAYRKGIGYNAALEAAREQAALGWRVELAFVPAGDGPRGRLELRLADMLGQPIERAAVQRRPHPPDPGRARLRRAAGGRCRRRLCRQRWRSRCPASGTCGCRPSTVAGPTSTTRRVVVPE